MAGSLRGTATAPLPVSVPAQTRRPGHVAPPLDLAFEAPEAASRRGVARLVAALRLVHPFPSLLDGLVVGVVAIVAGGAPSRALALSASTVLVQFAIGTLNDLVDAPRDRQARSGKPIAERLVGEHAARAVAGACAAGGLLLALVGGPLLVLIAAVGLAIGVWYDLAAKGTRLSWLPIAIGVPLLPVYGWYGATGTLPAAFGVLIPTAVLAGAALAIANAAVDLERDVASGATSLAVALGPTLATGLALVLEAVVGVIAAVSSRAADASTGTWAGATAAFALVPVAGALLGFVRARHGPGVREIAFEVQAVGLGLLAVAWINALSVAAA